jgi:hypothetical protein
VLGDGAGLQRGNRMWSRNDKKRENEVQKMERILLNSEEKGQRKRRETSATVGTEKRAEFSASAGKREKQDRD